MNITINVPDDMEEEINKLPNRDNLDLKDFERFLEQYRQSSRQSSTTNQQTGKWAKFAKKIKDNRELYRGVSKQIQKDSKEFREEFAFNSDK